MSTKPPTKQRRPIVVFVASYSLGGMPFDRLIRAYSAANVRQQMLRRRGLRRVFARPANPEDMRLGWVFPSDAIAYLKAEQARLDLCHVHLVHIGPAGFAIAHTNDERASGEPLGECDLHRWLHSLSGPPVNEGVWVATPHIPDAVQESYGADLWDFEAVELHSPARETSV